MASLTQTYTDTRTNNQPATSYARAGGGGRHTQSANVYELFSGERRGSHMPIDTSIHWDWRNPLNILPAFILLSVVAAVIGMVLA
ncbi:MAG TPA: hypothetical protein VFO07_06350 [Roseiflexaceae bacterium]|nr:hypothetical protein [Roseiflexaceae bacterium]